MGCFKYLRTVFFEIPSCLAMALMPLPCRCNTWISTNISLVNIVKQPDKKRLLSLPKGVNFTMLLRGHFYIVADTHLFDVFPRTGSGPVLLSFLPENKARAWLPTSTVTCSGPSTYQPWDANSKIVSDLSIVSCELNSEAHVEYPLSLVPMELCLPLAASRLWAVGFRDGEVETGTASLTPLLTSGLVTNCFPHGRGERMPSPCVEVDMETLGGMSGGPVFNKEGHLVGIVSSSFDGGPSYVTLIWDALRLSIKGLPSEIWKGEHAGILEGIEQGIVRVKGEFKADSKRNITMTLSDEEMKHLVVNEQ